MESRPQGWLSLAGPGIFGLVFNYGGQLPAAQQSDPLAAFESQMSHRNSQNPRRAALCDVASF